jgi:hypothetical protein
MTDTWPILYLAGLGAFHGLNPAMGWLFAVALGLHRRSRATVFASLVPIAMGHALSIAAVATLLLATGLLVQGDTVRIASGVILLVWAIYHWRYGHRHRVRFGMQVGLLGLAAWSFLMATAHGAGVMLWPALLPMCLPNGASSTGVGGPLAGAVAAVVIHTVAMLATTALVAALVYEWAGVAVLRRAWLNVDRIWTLALAATAGLLMVR